MDIVSVILISACFLCTLVAGFLFAFSVVVMPGIRSLEDREFIRAFQVMDGIIQNNQPIFIFVWAGSVVAILAASVICLIYWSGIELYLIISTTIIYLLGVQLPTGIVNVPLNNQLQGLDVDVMEPSALKTARRNFEPRWNRWNKIRTFIAFITSILLFVTLFDL